jgi:hypothetical protein
VDAAFHSFVAEGGSCALKLSCPAGKGWAAAGEEACLDESSTVILRCRLLCL